MKKFTSDRRTKKVYVHKLSICIWVALVSLLSLNACTNSNDGNATPSSLVVSGTAVAGLPIQGSIYAKDISGVVQGPYAIHPDGSFSLTATGLTGPLFLKAEGVANGGRITLYSVALEDGMSNINPMTDLILAMATGANHGQDTWDDPAKYKDLVTTASLSLAITNLKNLIQPFLTAHDAENADPFKDPIQFGKGLDAVFDRLSFEINKADGTLTVISRINGTTLATIQIAQINNASPINVDEHPSLKFAKKEILSWDGPSGMTPGVGLDVVSMDLGGTCVTFDQALNEASHTDTDYGIKVIETTEELISSMSVSANTSVKVGLYSYSGNARATYATEMIKDSYSVYVLAYIKYTGPSFNIQNTKLKSEWADKYSTNYPLFRSTCGDRYLSTITTGGNFMGILKITTTSDQEKNAVTADIKGKYSGVFTGGTASASFRNNMESLAKQYNATINIQAIGPPLRNLPTDLAGFLDTMETFYTDAKACADDYTQCAYTATFSDYMDLASGTPDIANQTKAINTLINYNNQYAPLLSDIAYMLAQPKSFETFDTAVLTTARGNILDSQTKVLNAASDCANSSIECSVPEGLLDPATVRSILPKRKEIVPQKCSDYKSNFPSLTTNDEYKMYLGGDLTKPYWLYCNNMNTDTPVEYLSLVNYSPISTSPSYNYSSLINWDRQIFTVYTKLKVLVLTDHLTVVRDDVSFATSLSTRLPNDFGQNISYGEAYTHWEHNDWDATHQGHANLDFTGLPFHIGEDVDWTPSTSNWSDSNWEFKAWYYDNDAHAGERPNGGTRRIEMSADRKTAKVHIAGNEGQIVPSGDLILKWSGQ